MSSSKQAGVIQDKPMSNDLQEKCVHKCSQLNWFHGESDPMALAEHQTFVKYEETDGKTSSRADQASPHFEWSAMHSSSVSRGRFSFQKLIVGEYCYHEDDEEDKKSEENDKEEEESISMPISHCPKREDATESIVIEMFNLKICEHQLMSRCIKCNGRFMEEPLTTSEAIIATTSEQVIPEFLIDQDLEFWQCSDCRQIYWEGTQYHNAIQQFSSVCKTND